ncbi:MAG: hypothetical protein LBI56_01515 [Puniceicoccales bacterium]|jgi:hypothetical protein|nr:hypothetical protein [Puniceicoccales bacterium]
MATDKSENRGNWCTVCLGDDFNWWIHEMGDDGYYDSEMNGAIDPKQVERMVDLLAPLKQYGLNDEVVNNAFVTYAIEKEIPKEMLRIRESKEDIFNARDHIFCLPNITGEHEGPFMDFLDHITALRVKLLNASFDFKQPLNVEEIEDLLHAERQERYVSGVKVHVFDEIASVLDYIPLGYSLEESEIEDKPVSEDTLDLEEFDDQIDESLDIVDEKNW